VPATGLVHHLRGQVETGRICPGVGEERCDVTRSGANLDHGRAVGQRGHSAQQPRLERHAGELIAELVSVGRRDRGIRRADLRIAGLRAAGKNRLAVDRQWLRTCRGCLDRNEQLDHRLSC
jgi:hypothetical protein